jgi:hypothetical protein
MVNMSSSPERLRRPDEGAFENFFNSKSELDKQQAEKLIKRVDTKNKAKHRQLQFQKMEKEKKKLEDNLHLSEESSSINLSEFDDKDDPNFFKRDK